MPGVYSQFGLVWLAARDIGHESRKNVRMSAPLALHIVLIDDHALIRSGLRMVVQAGVQGAVLREAASISEALRDAGSAPQPALVLLDIEMPGLNGLDGITLLKKKWPDAPVIILSSHTEPETMQSARARGAAAYLSKAEPSEKIIAMIERVLRGPRKDDQSAGGTLAEAGHGLPRLSARQCEVLLLISEGLSNKVIGHQLNLSENTVRGHVQAVLGYLNVTSRTEAAFTARRRGLIR